MSQQSKELVCCKSDQVVPQIKLCFCTKPSGPPHPHLLQARSQRHFMPPSSGSCPSALSSPPSHHLNPCTLHSTCTALAACFQLTGPVHLQFPLPGMPFPWESVRLFPHLYLLKWYLMETPSRTTLSAHPLTPPLSLLRSLSFPCCILRHSI